jgi:4-diphosphocytidyl-2-C-methyl-D-erythritol kinase
MDTTGMDPLGADPLRGDDQLLETHPKPARVTRTDDGRWMVHARAKLNLGLRVFPPRPDGFHDLETWMVPISWHDTLWVDVSEEIRSQGGLALEVTGRSQGVPTEIEKNLVGRAAVKLAAAAGIQPRGRITLHKVLPPGGGLGGGSSDAASALVALNEAWELRWEDARLEAIAAELGSDVPFFVAARSSLCTGRGEIMTRLRSFQPLFAVLIIPPQGCPTGEVYRAFDAGHRHAPEPAKTNWCQCASTPAEGLLDLLVNDLEPAAFSIAPWLAALRARAADVAGQKVHMTGSGSTLFTLCSSGQVAGELEARLTAGLARECYCVPVRILRQR